MKTFNLTEDHIIKGIRCNSANCPVALTLRENGYPTARVAHTVVLLPQIQDNRDTKWIDLPREVEDWIYDFDTNKPVKPLTFELDI